MDARDFRDRRWVRWLGLTCLPFWLLGCAPLPVAAPAGQEPALCSAPMGADQGAAATATSSCPGGGTAAAQTRAPGRGAKPARSVAALPPEAAPPSAPAEPLAPAKEEDVAPRDSDQQGLASWYGARFHGRRTASGEPFDSQDLTAAHRTLAFGTRVCVRSAITGKAVVVRINDRGPFSHDRVIDLSQGAAEELGMINIGTKPVELWRLKPDEQDCPEVFGGDASPSSASRLASPRQQPRASSPARTQKTAKKPRRR